jgi:hypothetical protein
MRRIALALAVLAVAGCGRSPPTEQGSLRPQDLTGTERQAFVYSAAIRYLVERGAEEHPGVVFVLDRAVPAAGDPDTASSSSGARIPQGVQDRVREELALLGKVKFVGDREEVIGPAAQGGRVRNDGVLITLGPVPAGPDRVRVAASSYEGNLGATWQTLVLERHGLRWRVEGTAGPVAMS